MNRSDKLFLENCYEKILQEQDEVSFEEKNGYIIEDEVDLNLNLEGLNDIEGYRDKSNPDAIEQINWDIPRKIKIKWFLMQDYNEIKGYLIHFDDIEVEYEDYRNSEDDSNPEKGKMVISSKGFDFKKVVAKFSKITDYRSDQNYIAFVPTTLELTAEKFDLINEDHEKWHELIVEY
jgi:hypothetical protein